jgi:hypothetical protein
MSNILTYAKAVAAAVLGLVTVVVAVIADRVISFEEIELVVAALGVLATAIGVYKVENKPAP